jgi:hypothetical protein
MGSITNGREAILAASFKRRSNLTNSTALANLGRFAASLDLFSHGRETEEDDWDVYNDRVRSERHEADTSEIARESADTGITPMEVIKNRQQARLDVLVEEIKPTLKIADAPPPLAFTDPSSVDFRDPADFYRTSLIKAAIDNDVVLVTELVEEQGASLYVRDVEGNDALQNALNFGNDEVVAYLQRQMAQKPLKATTRKTA